MLRVVIAVVIGIAIAFGSSLGVVKVASASHQPVNKPLYHYGSR